MLKVTLNINEKNANKTNIILHFTDSSLMSENNYVMMVGDEWSRIPELINRDIILDGKDTYDEELEIDFATDPEKLDYTRETVNFVMNNFDYFINLAYYGNIDKIINDVRDYFSSKRDYRDEKMKETKRIVNDLILKLLKIDDELVTNHPFIKSEPFYNFKNYNGHDRLYDEIQHNPYNDTFIGMLGGENSKKASYMKSLLGFNNDDLIIPSSEQGIDVSNYNTIIRYLTTDKFIPAEFTEKGGKFFHYKDRIYGQKVTILCIKTAYNSFVAPYLADIIEKFKNLDIYQELSNNGELKNPNDILKIRDLFNKLSSRNFYTYLDIPSCEKCYDILRDFVAMEITLEHQDILEINAKLSKVFFERFKSFKLFLFQKYKEFVQPVTLGDFGHEDYFGNITFKFYLHNPAKELNYLLQHLTNPIMSYEPEHSSLLGFIEEVYIELDKEENLKINKINDLEFTPEDYIDPIEYSDTDKSLVFINIQNIDYDPYEITFRSQISKTHYINYSMLRKCSIILLLKDGNLRNDKDFKRQLFTLDIFGLKERTIVCEGVQERFNEIFSILYKRQDIGDIDRNLKAIENHENHNEINEIDFIIKRMNYINKFKLNNTDIISFFDKNIIEKFNSIEVDQNEIDILKFNMKDTLENKYKEKLDLLSEFELSENNLDFYAIDTLLDNVVYGEKLEFFYEGHIIDLTYYIFNIIADKLLNCIEECANDELFIKLEKLADLKITDINKRYLLSIVKLRSFKIIVKYISRVLLLKYKNEFYALKRDLDQNTSSIFRVDRRLDKLIRDMYGENELENIILEIIINSTKYVAQSMLSNK